MTTQVQWTAPSPFWDEPASAADANVRQAMRQPAILRFVADTFMDDFLSLIETDPLRLKTLVAAPETWRGPGTAPSPPPAVPTLLRPLARVQLARASRKDPALATLLADRIADRRRAQAPPLKLYQPGQQRHYLLTASLVCQQASLPDRTLDTGAGERATFVMRRLLPGTNNRPSEFAFVKDGQGFVWQPVDSPTSLAASEEQLPMFSVTFTDDSDRRRRLLAGVVPVGRREAYLGAAPAKTAPVAGGTGTPPRADPIREPRAVMFRAQVIEPWKSLIERAYRTRVALTVVPVTGAGPTPTEKQDLLRSEREHLQVVSWYILLDLARLLRDYLPNVYDAVTGTRTRSSLGSRERDVYDVLDDTTLGQDLELALIRPERGKSASAYTASDVKASLLAALRSLLDQVPQADQSKLEKVTEPYDRTGPHSDWPSFLFPLADPVEVAPLPPNGAAPTSVTNALDRIDQFQDLLAKALPMPGDPGFAAPATPAPPAPLAAQLSMLPEDAGWFVMRCVFERPNCGPAQPAVLSDPTPSFQLAGFFDPDAPARPIRIALPLDTTPAGLRRFDKNTAFMISDTLCGQIDRVKGLSLGDLVLSILPWPFHKDLSVPDGGPCANSLGMICSLSIPIITICALLLLMIIVSLLDIVFRWLPFFIVCFPLPNFGAKRLPAAAPGG